jgi:tetratricopeptide (TPR) repeat protein
MSARRGPLLGAVLIVGTTFLIYSNILSYPFLFDDIDYFVRNHQLKNLSNLWPPAGIRYVGQLSFALNYCADGLDVLGYHLVNIATHAINGLLIFLIILLLFKTPRVKRWKTQPQLACPLALITAMVFSSHPLQTQAVTYTVQRLASLAALFYLLALATYLASRLSLGGSRARTTFLLIASVTSAILAMKTKENAFTLPLAITMVEVVFFEGNVLSRRRLLFLAPLLLTLPIVPLSVMGQGGSIDDLVGAFEEATHQSETVARPTYLLTQLRVVVTYLRLFAVPVAQNVDYDYPLYSSFLSPAVFLSFLFLLSILAVAIYVLFRSIRSRGAYGTLFSFGVFWFFLTLSVESSLIPIDDVIFEHRMYLPSFGLTLASVVLVTVALGRAGARISRPAVALAVVALTAIPLGVAAHKRNTVWKDGVTLWGDVIRKSPLKARGHNAYGAALYKLGRVDEAIGCYQRAINLKPDYSMAYRNLGIAYVGMGRSADAIELFQRALELYPGYTDAYVSLGSAYAREGRVEEAMGAYEEAIRQDPGNPIAHYNLGTMHGNEGSLDVAIEHLSIALKHDPDYAKAHFNIGIHYARKGLREAARREFQEVLRITPEDTDARAMLEKFSGE